MDRMRNATFCLSMPGDSASTRRLSETIMAGCIPVFIGTLLPGPLHPVINQRTHVACSGLRCSLQVKCICLKELAPS